MKIRFFIVAILLLGAVSAFSQTKVNWMSFQEAEAKNEVEPKKMLVFFETSWCGFCKKMDRTVFTDEQVAQYLNENYYAVRFDAESKESLSFDDIEYKFDSSNGRRGAHEIAIDMLQGYMAYPGVVFLAEDYTSIRILQGVQPKELFTVFLKYITEDAYKDQDWFEYSGQE